MAKQEFLMLADGAESTNGKIYILGGGSDRHRAASFPTQLKADIALAILVPWGETNQQHQLVLRIEDEDAKAMARVESNFDLGRPASAIPGQDLRFLVAVKGPFPIAHAGGYKVSLEIDGEPQEPPFRFWVEEGTVQRGRGSA
ncbi:MAG TPA: hypothetical protein VFX65_09190 [Candidatus Limnocylindrales bacterium]|nr:hypothetical protein [Candidatus Limnocylindrales bacterium]